MGYAIALPHAVRGVAVPYVAPMAVYCVRSMVWGRSYRVVWCRESARSYQSLFTLTDVSISFVILDCHDGIRGYTGMVRDGTHSLHHWFTLCTGFSPAASRTVTPSLSHAALSLVHVLCSSSQRLTSLDSSRSPIRFTAFHACSSPAPADSCH